MNREFCQQEGKVYYRTGTCKGHEKCNRLLIQEKGQ